MSKIEHDMASITAPTAEVLQARDTLRAARDRIDQALNVIDLWVHRPPSDGATPASS